MFPRPFLFPPRWLAALLLTLLPGAAGYTAPTSDSQLKAAYIVNFAKLTEWPSGALGPTQNPFTICLIGYRDGIAPALANLASKPVQGHPLAIRQGVRTGELRNCQMLVLEAADEGRLPVLLDALEDAPVLTVGDFGEFSRRGGMIELDTQDSRLVFDVNRDAAARAGLSFNAQLLKLARLVRQRRE